MRLMIIESPSKIEKLSSILGNGWKIAASDGHVRDLPQLAVDSLTGKFAFIDLGFIRDVEKDLDRIAEGEAGYKAMIQRVHTQLQRELSTLEVSATPKHPCPECGKPLRCIKGKSGFLWGCSGHLNCSATLSDEGGKPGQKKPLAVSNFARRKCEKSLAHRHKKGKGSYDFWGYSSFKDGCKETYPKKSGAPDFASAI